MYSLTYESPPQCTSYIRIAFNFEGSMCIVFFLDNVKNDFFMRMRVRRSTESSRHSCIGTQISNRFQRFMFQSVDLTRHASVRRDDPEQRSRRAFARRLARNYLCQNNSDKTIVFGNGRHCSFSLIWSRRNVFPTTERYRTLEMGLESCLKRAREE